MRFISELLGHPRGMNMKNIKGRSAYYYYFWFTQGSCWSSLFLSSNHRRVNTYIHIVISMNNAVIIIFNEVRVIYLLLKQCAPLPILTRIAHANNSTFLHVPHYVRTRARLWLLTVLRVQMSTVLFLSLGACLTTCYEL